ncbi:MAG TPA: hypothetical protein VEZ11_18680 [Thermoanaerobaculia bacterium]|nr:hypothetical protein [Thermoanaerobaculia bacterium]
MKTLFALIALLASTTFAQEQTFPLSGVIAAREVSVTSQPSWLNGGFGRLDYGAAASSERRQLTLGVAQLGLDWRPSRYFDIHVQGVGRRDQSGSKGDSIGVPEAYADVRAFFGSNQLQLRAGELFLPTSRENKESLWTSPYTITLSALNTWIGEEVRPVGADLEWRHTFGGGSSVTLAGTAFQGNDTMGALLAWRGWSMGNRLGVYGEVVPLPPLFSLRDPSLLGHQRSDGTVPIGPNLNGRTGFSGRVRWSLPERAIIQVARVDNRGDRELYRDQYSWHTRFTIYSAELHPTAATTVAAEHAGGSTGMGFVTSRGFVQSGFNTSYFLVSQKFSRMRLSARYDTFGMSELDHSAAENNSEHGHAWTIAVFYEPDLHSRTGVEYVNLSSARLAAAQSGFDPNTNAKSIILEYRYKF